MARAPENKSFGTPYSCGGVDSFYGREPRQHRWDGNTRTTDLTPEETAAYHRGYQENEASERKYEPEGDDYAEDGGDDE